MPIPDSGGAARQVRRGAVRAVLCPGSNRAASIRAWRVPAAAALLSALSLAAGSILQTVAVAGAEGPRWQDAPLWNDGRAEVSVFKATEMKYGLPRDFTAYFVVVVEDLRKDTLVKSDSPRPAAGLVRVFKMNQIYHFQAGIYAYDQMASVFLRLSDLAPVKETVTSREWCGNTFLELLNRGGKGTLKGFSYFDGEADTTQSLDLAGATLYDALPLALRALPFRDGYRGKLRLVPQLLDNRVRQVRPADARVAVAGSETVTTGVGATDAWKVEVAHAGGTDLFWFEKGAPNRLLRWDQADGGRYRLENVRRLAYWTMHAEGDDKALFEKETPAGDN